MLNSIRFSMERIVMVFLYINTIAEKVSLEILMVKISKIALLSRIETNCINMNQEKGFK